MCFVLPFVCLLVASLISPSLFSYTLTAATLIDGSMNPVLASEIEPPLLPQPALRTPPLRYSPPFFLASLNAIRLSPSTVLPLNQIFAVLVSRQTPKFELIYSSRRSLQPSPPYVIPHPFVCRPRGLTDRARIVQPCRRLPTTE